MKQRILWEQLKFLKNFLKYTITFSSINMPKDWKNIKKSLCAEDIDFDRWKLWW